MRWLGDVGRHPQYNTVPRGHRMEFRGFLFAERGLGSVTAASFLGQLELNCGVEYPLC